jgi:hypothetical protein
MVTTAFEKIFMMPGMGGRRSVLAESPARYWRADGLSDRPRSERILPQRPAPS